jgi:ribosomal protein S18 acetylase RimI-like enzyme
MTANGVVYSHKDAGSPGLVDQLVAIYLDVHKADPEGFYGEDRFRRQLAGHMAAPGWESVIAEDADERIGFSYGLTLSASTSWWDGLTTDVAEGFTTETGHRTFAFSELMVRDAWRGRGVAHALHDALLAGRTEERATLLVRPDNRTAQSAYQRWGWRKAAELRPAWDDAPLYDVMMRPITPRDTDPGAASQ